MNDPHAFVKQNGLPPRARPDMMINPTPEQTPDAEARLPKLIIEATADGRVNITGPVTNKFLCYALLELARDVIKDYEPSRLVR